MKQQRILIAEAEGKNCLCFDTGLDPRSFARTKLSQCFTEPGYIVCPDSTVKSWNAANVFILDGFMRVWGPLFEGERLDLLVNSNDERALQAVIFWIRARLFLGDTQSILNPGAAFIALTGKLEPRGNVLITPENLSHRCLTAEEDENEIDPFLCPDLSGMNAAAFCAAAMLYRIFTGEHAFKDVKNIYQDMRDGLFIAPRFVSYGMDEKLSNMIESALLLPVENKKIKENGTALLNYMLTYLTEKGDNVQASSFIRPVSDEEKALITAKKKQITKKTNITVKTKRFITRNKIALYAAGGAVLFSIFIVWNVVNARTQVTTKGLDSYSVITSYYEAFSTLNHTYMEACLSGADKSDVNTAINYYAIDRMRQASEMRVGSALISAHIWKEMGRELPAPNVFGITDLVIEETSGYEEENEMRYRARYLLWFPNEETCSDRTDDLTLTRKKGIWRITKIDRTINN